MAASLAEEIVISPLCQLAGIRDRIGDLSAQIAEAEEVHGIKLLREQKAAAEQEFSALMGEVAPTLTYSEDPFLKALKKKGESFRDGQFKIVRSARTTRSVLTEKFAAAFPDLLKSVCKVELTKADALVGKKTMDEYVEKKTTYGYDFQDLRSI